MEVKDQRGCRLRYFEYTALALHDTGAVNANLPPPGV